MIFEIVAKMIIESIVFCDVTPYSQNFEAAYSFDTLVSIFQTRWRHIAEDRNIVKCNSP
jgi:hypothetical protein